MIDDLPEKDRYKLVGSIILQNMHGISDLVYKIWFDTSYFSHEKEGAPPPLDPERVARQRNNGTDNTFDGIGHLESVGKKGEYRRENPIQEREIREREGFRDFSRELRAEGRNSASI